MIYKKIIAARKNVKSPKKKAQGYGYKYADLDEVMGCVNEALNEQGLYVFNTISKGEVITEICNEEGTESVASSIPLPQVPDPQKIGSAITYYRRYNLLLLMNLIPDDDDGNSARPVPRETPKKPQNKPKLQSIPKDSNNIVPIEQREIKQDGNLGDLITPMYVDLVNRLRVKHQLTEEQLLKGIKHNFNKNSVEELTKGEYVKLATLLEAKNGRHK